MKNMLLALLIFAKFTLAGQNFCKEILCSEFHDNPINSLVGNTKEQKGPTVSHFPFHALQFKPKNCNKDKQRLHTSCPFTS
jgi:hypothetical protein